MSSYVDATSGSVQHCQLMGQKFPDLAEPYYNKIATYCQQKLWHQLTLVVLKFLEHKKHTFRMLPSSSDGSSGGSSSNDASSDINTNNTFLAMYEQVIMCVHSKLNSLALAQIVSKVAFISYKNITTTTTLGSTQVGTIDNETTSKMADISMSILQRLLTTSAATEHPATKLYLESKVAMMQMMMINNTNNNNNNTEMNIDSTTTTTSTTTNNNKTEQLQKIHTTIKTNADLLSQLVNPDTPEALIVHSAHYEMSMTYFKLIGPPEAFYEEAIRYLNYYSMLDDVKPDKSKATTATTTLEDGDVDGRDYDEMKQIQYQLAVDLCLAALTGEGVYDLGQIVTNPILHCLQTTDAAWLVELLHACAKGNVSEFKNLVTIKYSKQISNQPALVHRLKAMEEKMTLLALVQMIFERPPSERTLSLKEISNRLELSNIDQVEWVIMRAFSVKLMEGSMDQVDGTVHITWVLPRVLDTQQLQALGIRFGEWAAKVATTKEYMQQQTPTLTA